MSPRVDYYLLDHTDPSALVRYCCRLVNKAYEANLRIFVFADSVDQANQINEFMWSYADTTFLPHALLQTESAQSPLTKICIGVELPELCDFGMLVNLSQDEAVVGLVF